MTYFSVNFVIKKILLYHSMNNKTKQIKSNLLYMYQLKSWDTSEWVHFHTCP